MCACVCACRARVCVSACVLVVSGNRQKEQYVFANLPGSCSRVVCAECLPRVYNDYYLLLSLESISNSLSSMREDSTSLAGQTPLTESGKLD